MMNDSPDDKGNGWWRRALSLLLLSVKLTFLLGCYGLA